MNGFELAQLNVARPIGPLESPVMARLAPLRERGPTPAAFTFRQVYEPWPSESSA